MNTRIKLLAGAVLCTGLAIGCEERPEARPAPDRTVTPPATTTTDTTRSTTTTTSDESRAQTLIQRAQQEIAAMQHDAAEQTISELEAMKSKLSASTQRMIEQLRTDLRRLLSETPDTPPTMTPPTTPPPAVPPGR